MGRPSKYPPGFREQVVELVKAQREDSGRGRARSGDQRHDVGQLGASRRTADHADDESPQVFDYLVAWGRVGRTRTQSSAEQGQRVKDQRGGIVPSHDGFRRLSTAIERRRRNRWIALSRR